MNEGRFISGRGFFFKFLLVECGMAPKAVPTLPVFVLPPLHILAISSFCPLIWVFFPPVRILQLIYTTFQHNVAGLYPVCVLAQFCGFVDHTERYDVTRLGMWLFYSLFATDIPVEIFTDFIVIFLDIHFLPISNNRKLNDRLFPIAIVKFGTCHVDRL